MICVYACGRMEFCEREKMDLCVSRREDLCVLGGGCGNRWSFEGDLPDVVERRGTLAG